MKRSLEMNRSHPCIDRGRIVCWREQVREQGEELVGAGGVECDVFGESRLETGEGVGDE